MTDESPSTFTVVKTVDRKEETEYIAQIEESIVEAWHGATPEGFLRVRNPRKQTEIHTRMQTGSKEDGFDHLADEGDGKKIGLDFTLRTALAAAAEDDIEYGETTQAGRVEVKPISSPEDRWHRRRLNSALGVRPVACRVRMAVFPDLENRVCRLPESTMKVIGIDAGDRVVVESSRDIARNVKALPLDEETQRRKQRQKERDPQRYQNCWQKLALQELRRTGVDIPEIFLDADVRSELNLSEIGGEYDDVCQPVRVYRDTVHLFGKHLYEFTAPLIIVLIGAALRVEDENYQLALFLFASVISLVVLMYKSKISL